MPRPGGLGVTARVHGSVACAWRVLGGASRILARDCGPRRSVLAGRRHFGAARGTVVGVAHAAESRAPRRPVQRAALHPPSAFFRQPGLGERRCCPLLVRVRRTMAAARAAAAPSAACRRRRRYRASTCNRPCRGSQRLWRCRGRRTGHGRWTSRSTRSPVRDTRSREVARGDKRSREIAARRARSCEVT